MYSTKEFQTLRPRSGLLLNNRPCFLPVVLQSSHPGKTGVIYNRHRLNTESPRDWAVITLLSLLHRKGRVGGSWTAKGEVAQNTQFLARSLCLGALITVSVISSTLYYFKQSWELKIIFSNLQNQFGEH